MNAALGREDATPAGNPRPGEHAFESLLGALLYRRLRAPELDAELTEAVCQYTVFLRNQGQPVERIIVRLKDVLRRAGTESAGHPGHPHEFGLTDAVVAEAVRRCIEQYYELPENADGH